MNIDEKKIIYVVVAVVLVAGVLGTYSWQNAKKYKVETPVITQDSEPAGVPLKTYKNEKYGFEFDYPGNFDVIEDKAVKKFTSGQEWHRVVVAHQYIPQEPNFTIEINPDGYGPFFPDAEYVLKLGSTGKVEISSEEKQSSENSENDGTFLVTSPGIKKGSNEFLVRVSFEETGPPNYGKVLRRIIESIRIK